MGLNPDDKAALEKSIEFERLRRTLKRALRKNRIGHLPTPKTVLEWAAANGLSVPEDLLKSVSVSERLVNWRRRYYALKKKREMPDDEDLQPKTRNSLERILLVMALSKYKYRFGENNSAASGIASDADRLTSNIFTEATVRNRLADAAANQAKVFKKK